MTSRPHAALPQDCRLYPLKTLPDRRGDLTEMFRAEWFRSPTPCSWQVFRGRANALAGIRVYAQDWLYVCLMDGSMFVSLTDLRPASEAKAGAAQMTLTDSARQVLVVAPGVAHGFYFDQPAQYLVGRVEVEDPAEHLLCAWNSPDLDVAWPCAAPELSQHDQAGTSFAEFKAGFTACSAKRSGA